MYKLHIWHNDWRQTRAWFSTIFQKRFDKAFLFQNLFQRKLPVSQLSAWKYTFTLGNRHFVIYSGWNLEKFSKFQIMVRRVDVTRSGKKPSSPAITRLCCKNFKISSSSYFADVKLFAIGQVMQYMILGKMRLKWSLILMDRLVSDIFSTV